MGSPVTPFLAAYLLGAGLGLYGLASAQSGWLVATSLTLGAASLALLWLGKRRAGVWTLLAGVVLLAWGWSAQAVDYRLQGGLESQAEALADRQVTFTGTLRREREIRGMGLRLTVDVETVKEEDGPVLVPPGGLVAYVDGRDPIFEDSLVAKQRVRLRGKVRLPRSGNTASGFSSLLYWRHQNVSLTLSVRTLESVKVVDPPPKGLAAALSRFRISVERFLEAGPTLGLGIYPWAPPTSWDRAKSLALALTTGERTYLSLEQEQDFRLSGLYHVLSISGLHFGILAVLAYWLLRALRLPPLAVNLGTSGILTAYAALTGLHSPTSRALVIALLYFGGKILGRRAGFLHALQVAALLLLAANPLLLEDIGFQLTFAAVAGIALLAPVVDQGLPTVCWRWLREGVAVAFGAQFGVFPLLAYYFQQGPGVSVFFLLPLAPILGFTQSALLVMALVHGAGWERGAEVLRWAGLAGAGWVDGCAEAFSAIPGSILYIPPISLLFIPAFWGMGLLYRAKVLLAGSANVPAGSYPPVPRERGPSQAGTPALPRLLSLGLAVSTACVAGLLAWGFWTIRPSGKAEFTAIDVGQGEALVLRAPDGRAWLLDAGLRRDYYDNGLFAVRPYLLKKGIRSLEGLIFTHRDRDHTGGLLCLLREFPAKYLAGRIPDIPDPFVDALIAEARKRRMGTILFPAAPSDSPLQLSSNDQSLVMMFRWKRFGVLLTSDIAWGAEGALVSQWRGTLQAPVLKVSHHGSKYGSLPSFLDAVQPSLAVISCGRFNRYRHPHPVTTAQLGHLLPPGNLFRTDQSGTIEMTSDGETLDVSYLESHN